MIRFALIVASTLGFVLTAALGNLMTPLLRAFRVQQEENEPPTMGGLAPPAAALSAPPSGLALLPLPHAVKVNTVMAANAQTCFLFMLTLL